ncbi:MAG: tetratricopeptide repeat protein [Myxococcota bacterium]
MSPLLLAVLVSAAFAKPKDDPAPAPPPAPAGPTDAARAAEFTPWATALASGNRQAGNDALIALIDDPSKAHVAGEAWVHLGEGFADQGLPLAAIGAIGRGMSLDPAHAGAGVGKGLALVDQTGEPGLVGDALSRSVGFQVDPSLRNQLAIVAARAQIDAGGYQAAIAILMMADKDLPKFEEVELLRGVALSQQGQYTEAIAPMLTASAAGVLAKREPEWQSAAALNVARVYYSAGNYGEAINWYAKVDRSSDFWLDSQFERAWAHFRGEDVNGALAMLFTHDSPFFTDFFLPEPDLLRAYSLFLMCKFPDATKQMDAFKAKYEPMQQELGALSMSPAQAWADVVAFRQDQPTKLPLYVLRPFRHEDRLTDAIAAVAAADEELAKAKAAGGRSGELAAELITTQRDRRIEAEGNRVLRRVQSAREQLGSMLEGIEITRLDLLNLEAQMYERAAATGKLDYGQHVGDLRKMSRDKRGFRVWPWEGEYWADELGWYVFNARPDCPETMARGETTP